MELSFTVFGLEPSEYGPVAEAAEALGFSTIWVADHVITPLTYASTYPYNEAGHPGYTADTPISDVWGVVSHMAARTTRLRFGTGVYILPLRSPFLTALSAATVQNLSGGRFTLGIGAGWLREEFDAVGAPFDGRGARMDDHLDVIRALWRGEDVPPPQGGAGAPLRMGAPPTTPVPVVMGGSSPAALRRAAECGDGWFGPAAPLEDSLQHQATLEALRRRAGRADRDFTCWIRLEGEPTRDVVRRHVDAGADHLVVSPWRAAEGPLTLDDRLAGLEALAEELCLTA